MARCRTHDIEFKRQVAQEYLAGETLHGLSKRHDIQRQLIRAEEMSKADPAAADYWDGYRNGLRRTHFGERHSNEVEHQRMLALVTSSDVSQADRGRGYQDGLRA